MTSHAWMTLAVYLIALALFAVLFAPFLARVLTGERVGLERVLGPVERLCYRVAGVSRESEMTWKGYALALLAFQLAGFVFVYALQRLQHLLPLNPAGLGAVTPDSSFNTAVSFVTNTNWQGYGGETTMSYLVQMAALTVQNFVSAATGIAVLAPLARALVRSEVTRLGNFWVDVVRSTLYVMLPLSLVLSVALVSQGVVQNFDPPAQVALLDPSSSVTEQKVALGPAASQVAVKQLGTNGGGFFNVNSAHPLENPTPFSNFLEMLAILAIPAAQCLAFGRMVKDVRQGWALLAAMAIIVVPLAIGAMSAEQTSSPLLAGLSVDEQASPLAPGGNMEGKEARFGIADSALWATATTAASNGSVNSMHDSFTPLGGLVPMFLMQIGEVAFGGVGSGLYGMIVFALVAVFAAGLMVGRTPEYIGKKLGAFDMRMASIAILAPCFAVLIGTAVAVASSAGRATIYNPGVHGFSEVLYAFSSAGNNNGSAFAGLGANNPFYNTALGLAMLVARYLVLVPVLALAGSLAAKKRVPPSEGTLPTHGPLFVLWLVAVVIIVGALTFLPALSLGPIVEHLMLRA